MATPCNCDTFCNNVTIDGNLTLASGGTLYVSPANVVPPSLPALRVTDGATGVALSGNPLRLNWDAPAGSPTYLSTGNGNIALAVAGNGNVGISTNSPQQALDRSLLEIGSATTGRPSGVHCCCTLVSGPGAAVKKES